MANFIYKVLDSESQIVEGVITAKNKEEAGAILTKKGYSPLVVRESPEQNIIHGTIPQIDKITFCRHLGIVISTGLSLSEGIEVLRQDTKHRLMRRILGDMSYSIEQGQQLSAIFARYPEVFEPYFLTLIGAGETSGKLSEVFRYLEMQLRSEYNLQSKVKGALLYPSVVFIAMIGIGILMFFFILPQIGKVFLSLKMPLPVFTQMIFKVSIALSAHLVPLSVAGVLFSTITFFVLKNRAVKEVLLRIIHLFPLVKNLTKKVDLARFNRIFSTLLKSAVPITEALEISFTSLSWHEYRKLAQSVPDEVRKGRSLSAVIKAKHIFPSLMIQMISAGEKTASIDSMLSDLATFYEQEVEEELHGLTQIIEPMLMLLVGIGVGIMILSIIAPIYSVVGNFQNAAGMSPR